MDEFSTLPQSRYRYAVPMPASTEKGSPVAQTARIAILLNFCHTVLRSDDELLRHAMVEYRQFLAMQQRA